MHAIRAGDGVPHVNLSSFGWALSAEELAQVRDLKLFEIFNGHQQVNNDGGGGVEQVSNSVHRTRWRTVAGIT